MGVPAALLHLLPVEHDAVDISYDNGTSFLAATDVQAALDEIAASIASGPFIRTDGTSITTASIPFGQGLSIDAGKPIDFGGNGVNMVGGGAFTDELSLSGVVTFTVHVNNRPIDSTDGSLIVNGDSFRTLAVTNTGVDTLVVDSTSNRTVFTGYLYPLSTGVFDIGTPALQWEDIYYSSQLISSVATGTKPLDVQSTTLCTNLNADLLDNQHGAFYLAFANMTGTVDISSQTNLAVTSPITLTGDTVGFSFATNNTWTGTNKIDVNSTSALFVEQNGVKDDTFIVDTTNGTVGVGVAPGTTAGLVITNTALAAVTSITRSLATRITSSRSLNITETLNWTGSAIGGASGPSVITALCNDNRILTGAATDLMTTLAFTLTRSSTFATGTTVTTTSIRAALYTVNDSGTYNNTSAGTTVNNNALVVGGSNGFTVNATGQTVTYNLNGAITQFNLGPTLTAGSLVLNYKGFSDICIGTAVGTTLGVSFYSTINSFDTNWFYVNDTTNNAYAGGDNSKTYWGTGTNALGSFTGAVGDAYIQFTGTTLDIVANAITSTDRINMLSATTINNNFTNGLLVEQTGVNSNTFIVDTTNGVLGMGVAAVTTNLLKLGDSGTTKANLIAWNDTIATRNLRSDTSWQTTHSWTGAGTGTLSAIRLGTWTISDGRNVNSGTGDLLVGLRLNATRNASFQTASVTSSTILGFDFVATEGGTYNTANNVAGALEAVRVSGTLSPVCNVGGGNTLTYNAYGTKVQMTTVAPTQTTGTLALNWRAFADLTAGTTTGTTVGASFYTKISGWDTMFGLFNDTAQSMYLGGDNAKSWWGTNTNTLGSFTGATGDASAYYDGTDFIINPREVGSGTLKLLGDVTISTFNLITDTTTGTKIGTGTTQKLGFFNATPIVQPVDGATLTNNVTSGGTTDTIANYTDLVLYANDSAAIRNNLYQLARKVKILTDNLRALGLES